MEGAGDLPAAVHGQPSMLLIAAHVVLQIVMVYLRRWMCSTNRMHRVKFTALWSILNIGILHGNGCLYVLFFSTCNYFAARLLLQTRYMKAFTWIFSLAVLLLTKLWDD
eukprot:766090-Hanusia_phi.AAC.2